MRKQSEQSVLAGPNETRFRGSIYVEIWTPSSEEDSSLVESADDEPIIKTFTLEEQRAKARAELEEYARQIPNSYVGGIAKHNPHDISNPFDQEI